MKNNPDWVHISYISEDANRRRCLKAYKENGKTKYESNIMAYTIIIHSPLQKEA